MIHLISVIRFFSALPCRGDDIILTLLSYHKVVVDCLLLSEELNEEESRSPNESDNKGLTVSPLSPFYLYI